MWCMPVAYHSGCIHRGVFSEDWGPRGWGTLIFSYRRRVILGVQNFEFHYFLGFQKNEHFGGYEDFVDIFWDHHKIGLYI